MSDDIEYCPECRHPLIWHSHPDRPGRCCGCTISAPRLLSPAYTHQKDAS